MATYVVGDIQGCFESFQALLQRMKWSNNDELWIVGDLVNRGPRSADVLRWCVANERQVRCVLGNHDIHLLACAGGKTLGKKDTLEECLSAPDAPDLIRWLRRQPILFERGDRAMVHAGLNPSWSWDEARVRARALESTLRTEGALQALNYAAKESTPALGWLDDLGWFTRTRMITRSGDRDEYFKGSLGQEGQSGLTPWFEIYEERREKDILKYPKVLFFGHWSALGIYKGEGIFALDSGCIWGRYLSAVRLEDGAIFQQPTIEKALTPKNQRLS